MSEELFVLVLLLGFVTLSTALVFCSVGWWRAARKLRDLEIDYRILVERAEPGGLADSQARLDAIETRLEQLMDAQDLLMRTMTPRQVAPPASPTPV